MRCLPLVGMLLACRSPAGRLPESAPMLVAEGAMVLFDPPDSGKSPTIGSYRFVLPTVLQDHRFTFIADHGASGTIITDAAIAAAGLPHRFARATRADTLVARDGVAPAHDSTATAVLTRGDSTFEYWGDMEPWVIDSLRVGSTLQEKLLLLLESPAASLYPTDGMLGRDILSQFDLEFNLPQRAIRAYGRSSIVAHAPQWLPSGVRATDCVPARVIQHSMIDTTAMDSTDMKEVRTNPGKRLWEEEELMLPLVMNGRAIDAHFDSGSGETLMNWAAARLMGLGPTSPGVATTSSAPLVLFQSLARQDRGALDATTYQVAGMSLRIGDRILSTDSVLISDSAFANFPDALTKPLILVGLREFQDDVLFLSYSAGTVCVGRH
ncbi:MAG: hypothetical protein ABJE47_16420 [bacterium]